MALFDQASRGSVSAPCRPLSPATNRTGQVHDFNYRRYPVVFLAGGGVGITPVRYATVQGTTGSGATLMRASLSLSRPHCLQSHESHFQSLVLSIAPKSPHWPLRAPMSATPSRSWECSRTSTSSPDSPHATLSPSNSVNFEQPVRYGNYSRENLAKVPDSSDLISLTTPISPSAVNAFLSTLISLLSLNSPLNSPR